MEHFLLIYDRGSGTLVRQETYASGVEALRARFAAEVEFDGRDELEIVAIDAQSESALRRSHGRYFFTLDELAARIGRPAA